MNEAFNALPLLHEVTIKRRHLLGLIDTDDSPNAAFMLPRAVRS